MLSGLCNSGGRAIVTVAVCALVIAAFAGCGGGNSDNGTTVAETVDQQTTTPQRTSGPTRAVLRPVDDSTASGVISYARKPDGTPLMKFRLEGLGSGSDGTRYVFWQTSPRHQMVVIAGFLPRSDGRIVRKNEAAIESFDFVEEGTNTEFLVTEMSNSQWQRVFSGNYPSYPPVIGDPVLRGTVTGSLVGALLDK